MKNQILKIVFLIFFFQTFVFAGCSGDSSDRIESESAVWDSTNWNDSSWQ